MQPDALAPLKLISGQPAIAKQTPIFGSPAVLSNLRRHKELVSTRCLECGYEGHMGIIERRVLAAVGEGAILAGRRGPLRQW
jgi:hypothetical protein